MAIRETVKIVDPMMISTRPNPLKRLFEIFVKISFKEEKFN